MRIYARFPLAAFFLLSTLLLTSNPAKTLAFGGSNKALGSDDTMAIASRLNRWWDDLQEADALVNQGDGQKAIPKLLGLLGQVPPSVRAMIYLRLASIYADQDDWDKAILNGKRAIKSAPSNGWVYLPVAKILHAAGQESAAIDICQEAIRSDPAVKQAAGDLLKELEVPFNPLPGLLALGTVLLGGTGGFWLWRRKKRVPPPLRTTSLEHSLPNYYPLTTRGYSPGDIVGHYRILSVVSNTLHSILYCAQDIHLDRQVALKQVNPGTGSHGDAPLKRFQKEVKNLIALSNHHAGVCKVYDYIEPGLLVMEWVDGDTLEDDSDLPVDRVLELGIELCNILAYAHSKGIIHRDIKPSNIMLSHTRQVRLLDFGIAKNATMGTSNLTLDGSVPIGTFSYMAPEQFAASNQAQEASDIYSLGLTLYRILAGRLPTDPWFGPRTFGLTQESDFQPISAETRSVALFLSSHEGEENAVWVTELDAAIRQAFRENPAERYASASEFGERLKGIWHRIGNIPNTGDLRRS